MHAAHHHSACSRCAMLSLLAPVSAPQSTRHTAHVTGDYALGSTCPDHVQWKDAHFPNGLTPDRPSTVFWLKSLFTPAEAARLVGLMQKAAFSDAEDSTDHLPSYELYLLTAGQPANSAVKGLAAAVVERARALVLPRFESCVLPFVRHKFECPECVPCISLARRYQPDERTKVLAHRDALARVTVVVELQAAAPPPKGGGLFIQQSEDAQPNYVPMRPGDAFLHDYELLHGVRISCSQDAAAAKGRCVRYSLIMWMREGEAECRAGGDVPMQLDLYRRSAEAGVAEGRYSFGRSAIQFGFDGRYTLRGDALPSNASAAERTELVRQVMAHLEAAATEQGHADAAVFLAELHLEGVPGAVEPDVVAAQRWRQAARDMGGGSQLAAWEETRGEKLRRHDEL